MNTSGLFDSGLDVTKWTALDWGVALIAGYAVWAGVSALSLSFRRLR